eukprot:CAMPEP_0171102980 /NCGR_PEP_ID=MMETSP0766_2-20121228/58668_1 /TAXON_ID=439317 /ORGANISM="Gambierdiscus australes, Strain CAWD 149" /LENGTH=76 /DNA_ID=CAMNT_0011563367 /DNA_START=72 /DNA_END=300 /DNA_ORIENTATION=+
MQSLRVRGVSHAELPCLALHALLATNQAAPVALGEHVPQACPGAKRPADSLAHPAEKSCIPAGKWNERMPGGVEKN